MTGIEIFLAVIVTLIAVGAAHVLLPGYVHGLLRSWRQNRKRYTYMVTINNVTQQHRTGRFALNDWQKTAGAKVVVLSEFN